MKINKIKTLKLIVIALLIIQNISAEAPRNSKLSIAYGTRDIWHTPHPSSPNDEIDLMNYFEYTNDFPAYEYLELRFNNSWNSKLETDFRIALDPSLSPNYLYLKGIYNHKKWIGFTAMYVARPQTLQMDEIFQHFDPKVYTYIKQTDGKRIYNYDHCFGGGVNLPIDYKFIHLNLSVNLCTSISPAFNRTIHLTANSTNYKAIYDYKVKSSISFFVLPELEINFDVATIGKANLGLQIKSNWMTTQKTFPYKLNKMEWTADNSVEQNVKPMKQKITKFEFDGGIYLRW